MRERFNRYRAKAITLMAISGSLFISGIAQATDTHISAVPHVYRLGDPSCGVERGEWVKTEGPNSAYLNNLRERSYAKLYQTGVYSFESHCCSTVTASNVVTVPSPDARNRVESLMSSPDRIGFGRRTTGGASAGKYTVVTNLNNAGPGSLRDAVDNQNGPLWITFSDSISGGTIYLDQPIAFYDPRVTVDGASSGITISVRQNTKMPMFVFRGGNAIVHGLTFDGNRSRSQGIMLREGDNYWIDHVTVKNFDADDALTIGQGSKGSTSASEITVSNYHASNTNFGILGGGEDEVRNYPPYNVTIHSSILSADDRNPKIKNYGRAHIFNSYIVGYRFGGMVAGANSRIYSEGNVFSASANENPRNAMMGNTFNGGRVGQVHTRGDLFLGAASTRGDIRQYTDQSAIPYSYRVKAANQVVDHVNTYAGAAGAQLKFFNTVNSRISALSTINVGSPSCTVRTRTIDFTFRPR